MQTPKEINHEKSWNKNKEIYISLVSDIDVQKLCFFGNVELKFLTSNF